jgi:iron complex outermembrane recepter protein
MKAGNNSGGRVAVVVSAILASAYVVAAEGQDSGTNVLDEIVVTAQKRSEKLQDVPVAVTVVDASQLAAQRVYTIADLARTTPSLEMIQAFGGPGGGGQIRGVGTTSFTRSAEGAVGIVVDGVPQGNVPNNAIFDIGQVEVLRGPQGTLFGLTSSAGVINMSTVAPDPKEFSSTVHLDLSNDGAGGSEFGQHTVRAGVNLPIGDSQALRLSVNSDRLEGVQRNAATGADNVKKDLAFRARYLLNAGDKVTVSLIADFDRRDQNYNDPQFDYVNVPAGSPLAAQLAACGIVASYDNNSRCSNLPNHSKVENQGFSGQVDWSAGNGTLTSITGYRKNEQKPSSVDIMGNPQEFTQIFITNAINDGRQLSQELRYASPAGEKLEYVVGAFYSDYKASGGYAPGGSFQVGSFQIAPIFIAFVKDGSSTETTNKAYAAFGQTTWHASNRFAVLGGLRYTHQKLTDDQSTNPYVPASVARSGAISESNVSGKIGVQYRFADSLNTYATITRGYKGPQVIPASLGSPSTVINAEIPTSYEIGAKGSMLKGRLAYEVAVFSTNVHDFQGQRCRINGVGVLVCLGESIPSVTSQGIEFTLFGRPAQGLNLNAGVIFNTAEFPAGWTGYNPSDLRDPVAGTTIGQTNLGGEQLVGVPKTKFVLNGDYSHAIGALEGFVGMDAVHKSEMRLAYTGDSRFVYPSHWTVGLRLGVRAPTQRWSAELFARNLGREREPVTLFGGPSFLPPGVVPFIPNGQTNGISGWTAATSLRQVGLSAEMRF